MQSYSSSSTSTLKYYLVGMRLLYLEALLEDDGVAGHPGSGHRALRVLQRRQAPPRPSVRAWGGGCNPRPAATRLSGPAAGGEGHNLRALPGPACSRGRCSSSRTCSGGERMSASVEPVSTGCMQRTLTGCMQRSGGAVCCTFLKVSYFIKKRGWHFEGELFYPGLRAAGVVEHQVRSPHTRRVKR